MTAPLGDARVGLVTCLYKGVRPAGCGRDLGALHINFGFLPSALLGDALGVGGGCFGATIALRRATLRRIGGFARVRDELADDHRIGDAVRAQGLAVVLSPYLVEASGLRSRRSRPCGGTSCAGRARCAVMAPIGFAGSVVDPSAGARAARRRHRRVWLDGAGVLLAATCVLRWAAAAVMARAVGLPMRRLWLLPLRDLLSFAVFVASFFGRRCRGATRTSMSSRTAA